MLRPVNNSIFSKNWIIPTLIFTILVLSGANAHPLWTDEAETALFARNINKFGIPIAWDGINIIGYQGLLFNDNLLNNISPWPQFYLVAIFFKLFGESSLSARLPFILMSIFIIPLIFTIAKKLTDKNTAVLTAFMASISIPLILFAYQARYYSLTIVAGLLLLLSCLYLDQKKLWPKLVFLLASVLYIYNHYLTFFIFSASLLTAFVIYLKAGKTSGDQIRNFIKKYLLLLSLAILTFLPWFFILKPYLNQGKIIFPSFFQLLSSVLDISWELIRVFNNNGIFPTSLILVSLLLFLKKFKGFFHHLILPVLIVAFYLLGVALISSILNTRLIDLPNSRYHVVLFPILIIISAQLLMLVGKINKVLFSTLLLVAIFTNLFTFLSPRSLVYEYIREVLNPYPSPDLEVAEYLNRHAREGETAYVNLERNHDPLIFYLGDKLRFINRIHPADKRLTEENIKRLPKYIYLYTQEPDWVIFYSKREKDGSILTYDYRGKFPKGLGIGVNLKKNYQEVVLPIYFSDTIRPEVEFRSFSETKPQFKDQVFIYKKL